MVRDSYSHEATLCGVDVVVRVEEWESSTSARPKRAVRVIDAEDESLLVLDKRITYRGLKSFVLPAFPRSLPSREAHVRDALGEARKKLSGASRKLQDETAAVVEAVEELEAENVYE